MSDAGDSGLNIDPALFREFLVESGESLDSLDELFVSLESHPDDRSIVDQIFRPIHSIKGNSSFFGLVGVKNLSHAMEGLLQEMRGGACRATPRVTNALLRGVDALRRILERHAAGESDTALRPEETALLAEFTELAAAQEVPLATDGEAVEAALAGVREALDGSDPAAPALTALETAVRGLLQAAAQGDRTRFGDAPGMRFHINGHEVTDAVGAVRSFVREVEAAEAEPERCEGFRQALEALTEAARAVNHRALLANLAALRDDFETIHSSGIGFDPLLRDLLQEKLEAVLAGIDLRGEKAAPEPSPASPAPREPAAGEGSRLGKTLRIEEEKVDHFMHYVGELIIASEVFAYLQKKLERFMVQPEIRAVVREFKNANLAFGELSSELQKSLMAVRRLPVRTVTQKLPRIARDTASQLDKEVELVIRGAEEQVDKAILEELESPLVHMVRNAVDHGIEERAAREAAGKPALGRVELACELQEDSVVLRLSDDGRGLDTDALRAQAVGKGVLTAEAAAALSDAEARRLIFGAGVSTARAVTEVSGRGVGMDVVLTNVAKLNGEVSVDSTPGRGTTITIQMPMAASLLVVDGMVARVGDEMYIIPLADIRESVRPQAEQVSTVAGQGEVLNVRGEIHRLIRLSRTLEADTHVEPAAGTVVLVEEGGRRYGLLVDEIVGQQSVVLKDLGARFARLETIRGGAILGDGRVGLVLDVAGVIGAAGKAGGSGD